MKHKHEDFNECTICNTQAALCKCGRDIRLSGGSKSPGKKAICNTCKYLKEKELEK